MRRSARSARRGDLGLALACGLGQQVGVDAGADEVADELDGVTLAVERVAPQIGVGGDVGIFGEQAFADGSDEGGRLLLLPGCEGRRGWGDVWLAHGGATPQVRRNLPNATNFFGVHIDDPARKGETASVQSGERMIRLSKRAVAAFKAKPLETFLDGAWGLAGG